MKFIMLLVLFTSGCAFGKERFVLEENGFIPIVNEITYSTAQAVISDILSFEGGDTTIIYLDSPGGSVMAGMQIIEAMKASKKHFTCVASFAASMAFAIFQACDARYLLETGTLMQHQMSFGLNGQLKRNISIVEHAKSIASYLNGFQAARLGMSERQFEDFINDDVWLFGVNAIKRHAADELALVTCAPQLASSTVKKTVTVFIFSMTAQFSKCPLLTGPVEAGKSSDRIKQINIIRN